ncbi:MAG: c-type cytochrome [Planctomycetes bacterium]|nr:c-type cytochrome [Planctomycetota bacterium]
MSISRTLFLAAAVPLFAACGGGDPPAPADSSADEGRQAYVLACASCHGEDRLGLLAPPLLASTVGIRPPDELARIVRDGIPGTRMPGFALTLPEDRIARIVEYVRLPIEARFTPEDVRASRKVHAPRGEGALLSPVADVTAVVERGTGNILFLVDGRLVREIFFPNVHGGLKYQGEHLFVPARTGFLLRVNLRTLEPEVSVRAGIYLRNAEVCGNRVVAACSLPPSLAVFDLDLALVSVVPLPDEPTAVVRYDATRLLVGLKNRPELLVVEEGKVAGRIAVPAPFRQLEVIEDLVIGSGERDLHVTDLARHATVENERVPHLAAGTSWRRGEELYWAAPKIDGDGISVYRIGRGDAGPVLEKVTELAATALPVRGHTNVFVRSYPEHDFFVTTSGEEVLFVSKEDFRVVHKTTPRPGAMPLHTEFSADGSILFVSLYDDRGGIYQYSTKTFSLLDVIPAARPAGQYDRTLKSWREFRRTP